MNQLKDIMETQLTERELMIFLLVENGGYGYRELAAALMTTHKTVSKTYESAKKKLDTLGRAFQTPVDNSTKKH